MVDILTACFNSEKYIGTLLDSLENQTCKDMHIIVGDDGSTDKTLEIVGEYAEKFGNIEVLKREKNCGGAKENFFDMLKYSKSKYVMFCDHDDFWLENKVEKSLSEIKKAEEKYGDIPLLVHTDLQVADENLLEISSSMFEMQKLPKNAGVRNLLVQNCVTGCTMLFNDKLRDIVKYKNLRNIIMHDHYLALVAAVFGKIVFLDEATIKYRQHGENEVGAKDVSSAAYVSGRIKDKRGIKDSLAKTYAQAREFYDSYKDEIPDDLKEMIKIYGEFDKMPKSKRLHYMKKYGLYKNTLTRKIGQLIWG